MKWGVLARLMSLHFLRIPNGRCRRHWGDKSERRGALWPVQGAYMDELVAMTTRRTTVFADRGKAIRHPAASLSTPDFRDLSSEQKVKTDGATGATGQLL